MNTEAFYNFSVIAKEKNITRAAEKLHISQQALSEQMRRIEQNYGIVLFQRSPDRKGIRLTHEGESFLEFAEQFYSSENQFRHKIEDVRDSGGEIRFGISFSRSRYFLPIVLEKFYESHRNIAFSYKAGYAVELEKRLLSGELDLAMTLSSFTNPKINTMEICREDFYFVVSRKYLVAELGNDFQRMLPALCSDFPDELLENIPLLRFPLGINNRIRDAEDIYFSKRGILPNERLIISDNTTQVISASHGLGGIFCPGSLLAVHPDLFTENGDNTLYLFPITDPDIQMTVIIGYLKNYFLSRSMLDFISLIQSEYANLAAETKNLLHNQLFFAG